MFAYQIVSAPQTALMFVYQVQELGCGLYLTSSLLCTLPTQMGMSLQTAIHAFCFALTLVVHTVASERKFCSIHAYILIACSFSGGKQE